MDASSLGLLDISDTVEKGGPMFRKDRGAKRPERGSANGAARTQPTVDMARLRRPDAGEKAASNGAPASGPAASGPATPAARSNGTPQGAAHGSPAATNGARGAKSAKAAPDMADQGKPRAGRPAPAAPAQPLDHDVPHMPPGGLAASPIAALRTNWLRASAPAMADIPNFPPKREQPVARVDSTSLDPHRHPDNRHGDSRLSDGRHGDSRHSDGRLSDSRMPDGRMSDGRMSDNRHVDVGRRMHIGRDITISGEIKSCGLLEVEGSADAQLSDCGMLQIAETGSFHGTAVVESAEISGRFDGEMTVSRRLTIQPGGHVIGNITYGELEIMPGGKISGSFQPAPENSAAAAALGQDDESTHSEDAADDASAAPPARPSASSVLQADTAEPPAPTPGRTPTRAVKPASNG